MALGHGRRLNEARLGPRPDDERVEAVHEQDAEQERRNSECRFAERGFPADRSCFVRDRSHHVLDPNWTGAFTRPGSIGR